MKGLALTCFLWGLFVNYSVRAADNGLAARPPMGWMSWERFMCNTDCYNYPKDCISESLVKSTADALVAQGLLAAGYEYLALGDCWMAPTRDSQGGLVADPKRFPSGIKSLVDYVHSRGLKFGLYLSAGNQTRSGFPGSQSHLETDANNLAAWGVDMLQLDANGLKGSQADQAYQDMAHHLNATGRPILLACMWPLYSNPDLAKVQQTCNTFRTYKDIYDGWQSLKDILHYFGDNSKNYVNFTGVGSWVDPDQVLVGDFGLSPDQQQLQMAVWAMVGAPLFVSADVRQGSQAGFSKDILLNKKLLAISQDNLTTMGRQVAVIGQVRVWRRPVSPRGSFALALSYENVSGGPNKASIKLQDIGLTTAGAYNITDVFTGQNMGTYLPWYTFNCQVNPTGVRLFYALAIP